MPQLDIFIFFKEIFIFFIFFIFFYLNFLFVFITNISLIIKIRKKKKLENFKLIFYFYQQEQILIKKHLIKII